MKQSIVLSWLSVLCTFCPLAAQEEHAPSYPDYIRLHTQAMRNVPVYEMAEHISQQALYKNAHDFWLTFEEAVRNDKVELMHGLARHYIRQHGNPANPEPFYTQNLPSKAVKEILRKQYFLINRDEKVLGSLTIRFAELMCSIKIPIRNSRVEMAGFHLSDVKELADYYALTGVRQLNLSNNCLTSLPPNFAKFKDLRNLELTNNKLTKIPATIGQLTNLWRLDLAHNKLCTLPKEIGLLTNLWRLDVRDNLLQDVPKELSLATSLSWLWLEGNPLKAVPKEVGTMKSLTQLRLD